MHRLGYAHSIEYWVNNNLVGGLYGIHIGGCFFGESMFSRTKNASKYCLLYLISILNKGKFKILDSQLFNPHLLQFGAYEVRNKEYQIKLKKAIKQKCIFINNINQSESISILQSLTQTS